MGAGALGSIVSPSLNTQLAWKAKVDRCGVCDGKGVGCKKTCPNSYKLFAITVPAQIPVTLVVNTRRNAKEITLQLDKGQTFGQGPVFKDNQVYVEDLCLPSGRHRLKFFDTFGDGWSGGYWSLKNADGKLFGGGPTAGQVAGTGGEVAFNVDEKNPGSMAVETRVRLHIKTGRSYSNRVCRWNIDGGTNFGSKLRPNHHYFFSFKLPSGKHKLNMVGTKKGWGQGAWFELQEDRKDARGRTTRKTV
eukprot:COSAG01_NODE_7755_length_3068_cov_11.491748_3_plen_246_part_01